MAPRPRNLDAPLLIAALLCPLLAAALVMTGRGNAPVHDAGWPEGALAVANLESRVGWWEGPPFGGGEWQFEYRGDTAAFVQALTAFSAIRAPLLDLVLHDGPQEGAFLREQSQPEAEARIDWTFTVWNPLSWHRLFNDPRSVFEADHPGFRRPVDPPRLDVYLGGGGIDWTKVTVPPRLRLRDERAVAAAVDPVGGALLRVDVYDMATGKPVQGARLQVERRAGGDQGAPARYEPVAEASSDAAGRVQLERVPAGDLRLQVVAAGYAPRLLGQERYGERTFKCYTVEMAGEAALQGTVQDTEGKPLAGVKVLAVNSMAIDGRGYPGPTPVEAVTNADGAFELAALAAGYTQVRVRAPDYTSGDQAIHAVPGSDVLIRVGRTGRIVVSVVDAQGLPLSRFEGSPILIEVEPKGGSRVGTWGGSAPVKDDGTLEFAGVLPDEYRVSGRPNPATVGKQYAPDQLVRVEPGGKVTVRLVVAGPAPR